MHKLLVFFLIPMCSCSYSIIMNHTDGTASDMVDETQSPSADVKIPVTVPIP